MFRYLLLSYFLFSFVDLVGQKLWYNQQATTWMEALPIGNGRLAAMVFGRVREERIQINEESVWAGMPINVNNPGSKTHLQEIQQLIFKNEHEKAYQLADQYMLSTPPRFRSYQTLGDVWIDFGNNGAQTKNYKRELDLNTGITTTEYIINGVQYIREAFVSVPDNVIVLHFESKIAGALNCKFSLARTQDATTTVVNTNTLELKGQIMNVSDVMYGVGGAGVKFNARLHAMNQGGILSATGNTLLLQNGTSITLLITGSTDYNFKKLSFDRTIDPQRKTITILNKAKLFRYDELRQRHIHDFSALINRVSLALPTQDSLEALPTNVRLSRVKAGAEDPGLIATYFQYGRYLLASSSRHPGVLPANLQGKWNEHYNAPWESDYHTNINIQMNYWPSEVTNLTETNQALFEFIDNYRIPGRVAARELYGAKGWMMHHATDIFGKVGINAGIHWGTSPLAAAWLCTHLWEHFLFTRDTGFLKTKAYPIIKECVEFIQSFLILDARGRLVTNPSMSPENTFKLPNGKRNQITYAPSIDNQIIQYLYKAFIESATILHHDADFVEEVKTSLSKIPPIEISPKYNIIQEWIEDYDEAEPGHRHMSQLIGLHPLNLITPATPELYVAAKKTIERRLSHGGGHTGWSRAWMINFYARLLDGEEANKHLKALLQKSTHANLFDDHPPFQIDGNFGATAGIAEMLMQSQNDGIHILPALPMSWHTGTVKGLCARGGYVLDMEWKDSMLAKLVIRSKFNGPVKIYHKDKSQVLAMKAGETVIFNDWK